MSSIFFKPPRATLTCRQILRRPVGHFQINVWNRLASQVRTLTGPTRLRYPSPCIKSSDLYQFQERPLAKVGWTCRPQSTPWRRHCTQILHENRHLGEVIFGHALTCLRSIFSALFVTGPQRCGLLLSVLQQLVVIHFLPFIRP